MGLIVAKIGDWVKNHRRDLWVALCIGLVGWSAYNLGQIYAPNSPLRAKADIAQAKGSPSTSATPAAKPPVDKSDPRVFASKSSTAKKYYYSWCSSRVKDANKIWFASEATAQAKGYTLAANCH